MVLVASSGQVIFEVCIVMVVAPLFTFSKEKAFWRLNYKSIDFLPSEKVTGFEATAVYLGVWVTC